jgi:hypothetical protein
VKSTAGPETCLSDCACETAGVCARVRSPRGLRHGFRVGRFGPDHCHTDRGRADFCHTQRHERWVRTRVPASTFETLSVAGVELPVPLRDVSGVSPSSYGCVDETGLASIELEVDVPEDVDWFGYRLLAVTGDWDVQPRPVSAVGVDSPVYQQIGESMVPADQPVDPTLGDVVQVLRADLDGNGIEEVLFTFQHLTDSGGMGAPGDFSLVIARYPDSTGAVVDEVLAEHFVPTPMDAPSPDRSRVRAIADLNGDGAMEVAIGSVYWESAGVEIYEFDGGALHEVMSSGCGV